MSWELCQGDCIERMRDLDDCSIDAVVTDPPYGIGFMGNGWDSFDPATMAKRVGVRDALGPGHWARAGRTKPRSQSGFANPANEAGAYDTSLKGMRGFQMWCEAWAAEALRVLKPGGHLVSFGGTRTYHRLVCGVEDAGFEIRDQLAWLFGSGFPKSRNLGDGRGTALKPAHEPIVLARKPMVAALAANAEQHGTGPLNIDACRIPIADVDEYERNHSGDRGHDGTRPLEERGATDMRMGGGNAAGARWPANVMLDEETAELLDDQVGELVSGANPTRRGSDKFRDVYGDFAGQQECDPARGVDRGGPSRFFYCPKTSRAERNAGCEPIEPKALNWSSGDQSPGTFQADGTDRSARNHHPTVKPIELMRWLCRLVTPPGGALLDPFTGSGSTGCAAVLEGLDFIGLEREPDYIEIAQARIRFWETHGPDALAAMAAAERAAATRAEHADVGQLDLLGDAA